MYERMMNRFWYIANSIRRGFKRHKLCGPCLLPGHELYNFLLYCNWTRASATLPAV